MKSDKTEEKEYISIFENDTRKLKKMDYSDESKLTVVVSLNHEYIFILEIKKKKERKKKQKYETVDTTQISDFRSTKKRTLK